jgi:metallophosphoesterase (TIGR03767 family)
MQSHGAVPKGGSGRSILIKTAVILAGLVVFLVMAAAGTAAVSDTEGQSTVEQRVVPTGAGSYRFLQLGAGEPYTVRQELASAAAGRAEKRTSLVYFGQLSDFQLADEESPARVEVVDPLSSPLNPPFGAAWRPWEALEPQLDDAMIRQFNQFAGAAPVADGSGSHRAMDFTIDTGDSADSQQLNETQWVRTLLEGGTLNPNSGVNKKTYSHPLCPNLLVPGAAEAAHYTGVQDYDDYFEGAFPEFYDPDSPAGPHAAWPKYPGLMDRAQQTFTAQGLDVPSYVTFGNHDALVQGNAAANAAFEQVATGCLKPIGPVSNPENAQALLTSLLSPTNLLGTLLTEPQNLIIVPGDPKRQFVSKKQYKDVFKAGAQADGHGFDYIDPAQEAASKGAAGYYSWSPTPGMRFIALDTVAEAGTIVTPTGNTTSDGNIDDPQFKWLRAQLEAATAADELVVIFSHHAPESLTADAADELAPLCTLADAHGHDINPGCDLDPRSSQPIHLEADAVALLHEFPNAIAWVSGHSHDNIVNPFPSASGPGGFWSIRVAAEADWPQQGRLLEVFDNHDGTLSIFGTILDHVGQSKAPVPGTSASGMDLNDLASAARTMSFNDLQSGAPEGEGEAKDRNVELLVPDPR